MRNKVYVTKDKFVFDKKVKIENPIIISSITEAVYRPLLKNYTYLLISDVLDEKIFELKVPIIQYMTACNKKHKDIVYLEDYAKEQLRYDIEKKYSKDIADNVLSNCETAGEMFNELYKHKYSSEYKTEFRFFNEKHFCKYLLEGKKLPYIPNYAYMYVSTILFSMGGTEVQAECLDFERLIKKGEITENYLLHLINKINKVVLKN